MKRKLNKQGKLLLILLCMLLIIILLIVANMIGLSNKDTKNNNEENTNIEQQIDKNEDNDDENGEIIKVIIDESKNDEKPNQNNNTVPEPNNNDNNKNAYYIKVNTQANVVTIYKKDSEGKYTVPVKAMICSIGEATPLSGVYKTSDKYTWRLLEGNVYGQYAVRIVRHILFHSVPYTKKSKDSLEWWEYDKLGTDASLGCVRLTVEDAKWIYDNCAKGTQVEFYSDSDPGPLGKPTAKKISSYSDELKNWDPTDPDSKNPWRTCTEPTSSEPEE